LIKEKPGSHGTANREKKGTAMVSTIKGDRPANQFGAGAIIVKPQQAQKTRPFLTGLRRYLGWFADGKHQHIELEFRHARLQARQYVDHTKERLFDATCCLSE
jgi:DNA primase